MSSAPERRAGQSDAQATVEAAIVLPILIALALITYNLMMYCSMCARFEKVATTSTIACAVSPASQQRDGDIEDEITAAIIDAMGSYPAKVTVVTQNGAQQAETMMELIGAPNVYTVTLAYTPWPSSFQIAGVSVQVPIELTHEVVVTVDPWRPGIVA